MPPRRKTNKDAAVEMASAPPAASQVPSSPVSSQPRTMTDEMIHAELRRYDSSYTGSGPLTQAVRDVRIKKIHHYEVRAQKEIADREKKEKAQAKKDTVSAKNSRGGKRVDLTPEKEAQYVGLQITEPSPVKRVKIAEETVVRPGLSSQAASSKFSGDCLELVVTDTSTGSPARNLTVSLNREISDKSWLEIARRTTDDKGECPGLITRDLFNEGIYRLRFESGDYFGRHSNPSIYPYVEIVFEVEDRPQKVGMKLFIGPHSYSTYRTN